MNQGNNPLLHITSGQAFFHFFRQVYSSLPSILLITASVFLLGCPPDNTPLLKENEELTKQAIKKDSMLKTLEEGNRVLQEQINRLSQELREKERTFTQQLESIKESGHTLTNDNQQLTLKAARLTKEKVKLSQEKQKLNQEKQKLKRDNDWLRRQRDIFRQSLKTDIKNAKSQLLTSALRAAVSATTQALSQHGYALLGNMATDQRAFFITERKTSISKSIELPGFRNQYVVVLEATTATITSLRVKAFYEKLGGGGKLLEVGPKEISEIEGRLIQAIEHILNGPEKKAK